MTYESLSDDSLRLLIVAEAKMSDGFCYIGWDMDRHELVRPVLRKNTCRWFPAKDVDLKVGEKHLFKIRSPNLEGISYPHRANDVLVKYIKACDQTADSFDVVELYDILIEQSHPTVKKVFGNMDEFNGEYFLEHTKCPSVGIYKCKRNNLKITRPGGQGEPRCEIMEDELNIFNFKITAVDKELPDVDLNEDVLVILGLGRPYKGTSHQYTKLRCFILVVGFVAKQTNTKQCSPFKGQLSQSVKPEGLNANGIINSGVKVPSSQPLAGVKRKLEANYAISEDKLNLRRLKTQVLETSRRI